jgi:hypothetical protein
MVTVEALFSGVAVTAAGVVAWAATMEVRTRHLEQRARTLDVQQKIILRGLVRMGVLTAEEVEEADTARAQEGV